MFHAILFCSAALLGSAIVRPERYAQDPGAGFPVVVLTDVAEPTPEIRTFADRFGEAVFACAEGTDREALLAELRKDPRLFAFTRGRIEIPTSELAAEDAADKLRNYFKWGRYQAAPPKVTRYGARIYRKNRMDSAAPTVSVPAPWRVLEGDDGETGCDVRLAYFTVEADGGGLPPPEVTVTWPGVAIASVDGAKNVKLTSEGAVLTPTAPSGGANYLTMVREGTIELALHHHVEGAQHGPYAGRTLPWKQVRASDNWRAACFAAFKAAGLGELSGTDGANVKLYGFDSNFPRRHVDFPEHFHVMLEWDRWTKNNVGHYTLDERGFIRGNNFLVCGDIAGGLDGGYHPQKPGEATEYVGPKGRVCFSIEMLADGKGLVLRKPGSGRIWRLRSERPDEAVVVESRDGDAAVWERVGTYSVKDDTETGRYVISNVGTDGSRQMVIAYRRDTGALLSKTETPALTVYPMLTQDGRRLVGRTEGTNVVYELVSTNALPNGGGPMREWKLYCVKATHTDIGLHNSPYIQRHGTVRRIEDAARLVDADTRSDDDPAAYRYVLEGTWFWENYPMDRGEDAAWRIVTNYMARGRMDVGVTCAGNHTHLFSKTELERSTLARRRMVEKWGVRTKTFLMADNPGISCSVIAPYVRAGIRYGLFLPNQWNPLPSTIWKKNESIMSATWNPDALGGGARIEVSYDSPLPMVFRWQAPGGEDALLMWCSTQYHYGYSRLGLAHGKRGTKSVAEVEKKMPAFLAILEKKYPYDVWLAGDYEDDEDANTEFADFAAAWNRKWAWPQFRTVGRLDEPFEYLEQKFGDKIPVLRGEMTSGWLQHAASTPELLADKLNADRLLATAERLGTAAGTIDRQAVDRAWECLIFNDEHSYGTSGYQGRRVFETWMQHRDWIERAAATASNELAKAVAKLGLAPNRPDRVEVRPGTTEESAFYRVSVNGKGEIVSLYDKALGRELLSAPANRFLYTQDNHRTWSDEALLGAAIARRVYLPRDVKRVDVEDRFEHARDLFNARRYYRYGYLAFPFDVPDGAFKAQLGGGEVIRPYEDCHPMTADAFVAVRDWCKVENAAFGVALMMRDSTLTEFGEIHPDKTCYTGRPPKGKTGVYPYLFTDWLQMHQPDGDSMNFTFRFSITSYATGEDRVAELCEDWLDPYAQAMRNDRFVGTVRNDGVLAVGSTSLQPDWTGLLERPRAGHGEKDGQLYLLWGVDLSPALSHYELWRDGSFLANVTNEAPNGIPYRVARYEDTGLPTHSRHAYRLRKVWKDGTKDAFGKEFTGMTRYVSEEERNGVVCEGEWVRLAVRFDGAQVTSWKPEALKGAEVFFLPKVTPWGREVHGGLPICWPWFAKAEKEGLPKHGLVRYQKWELVKRICKDVVVLRTQSSAETRKLWPHDFELTAKIAITGPSSLEVEITERNTGTTPFVSACALHPYLSVAYAEQTQIDGEALPKPWVVRDLAQAAAHVLGDVAGGRQVEVTCPSATRWVLWNPGVERTPLCEGLADDDWRRFYCLEPVDANPAPLAPGASRTHRFVISISETRASTSRSAS